MQEEGEERQGEKGGLHEDDWFANLDVTLHPKPQTLNPNPKYRCEMAGWNAVGDSFEIWGRPSGPTTG